MYSTVIAAESFAGERERKTIEALLYTPASDAELFLGKVLAGAIPAVAITWISFVGYCVILNAGAYSIMDKIWFPLTTWYPLIFWVSPALSLLGIAATVLIPQNTNLHGRLPNQRSLVVLVLALVVGQATGILYLSVTTGLLVGLVFWLVDIVLVWLTIRSFNREKLLASEK
jgi:ABC-type Na+ efflux pump permease subunit